MDGVVINFLALAVLFLLLLLTFLLRLYLMRRAVFQVIALLRTRHSSCSETPKTLDELGLRPPDLFARLTGPKDYKPYALEALIEMDAVRVMPDDRVCLIEGNLSSRLRERPGYGR